MSDTYHIKTYTTGAPVMQKNSGEQVRMTPLNKLKRDDDGTHILISIGSFLDKSLIEYSISIPGDTVIVGNTTLTGNIDTQFDALNDLFPKANGGTGGSALPTLVPGSLRNNGTTVAWSPDVDYSFLTVTYAATVSRAFDPLRPNLKMTLGGNLDFTLTGVTEGLGGELYITRGSGGSETITLNGVLVANAPTGAGVVVSMAYENQAGTTRWFCQNQVSTGGAASAASIVAVMQQNGYTTTPPAPTALAINDSTDTATWTPAAGYETVTHETSTDSGSTWADETATGSKTGLTGAYYLKVRVKAGTLRNAGTIATSGTAFTAAATATAFVTSIANLATPRNDGDGYYGFIFTVGSTPITITDLGRYIVSGNSASHVLKLIQYTGGYPLLASCTLATSGKTAGAIAYQALGTPYALSANTAYIITSDETASGDFASVFGPPDSHTAHTAVATIDQGVYGSGGTYSPYGDANTNLGVLSFKYT